MQYKHEKITKADTELDVEFEEYQKKQDMIGRKRELLVRLDAIDFSPAVSINPFGDSVWLALDNREDLALFLTLAQVWKKDNYGKRLAYTANVGGILVILRVSGAGLPPTCRVVRKKVVVPATEAYVEIKETIVCDTP